MGQSLVLESALTFGISGTVHNDNRTKEMKKGNIHLRFRIVILPRILLGENKTLMDSLDFKKSMCHCESSFVV
jgi:hypothetical protein